MMCSCDSWLIHIMSNCGLGMVHMGWVTCMRHTYEIWIYGAYGLPVCVTHIRYESTRHDLFNMTWRVNSFTSSAIARCVWCISDGLPVCVTHMRYEPMRHDVFNMIWRVRLNHDSFTYEAIVGWVWCIWDGLPACVTHMRYESMRFNMIRLVRVRHDSSTSSAIARCVWCISDGLPMCVTHMRHDSMRQDSSTKRYDTSVWNMTHSHLQHLRVGLQVLDLAHIGRVSDVSHMYETWLYKTWHHDSWDTGWQRPIGCLKSQVIFRKRATNYIFCGQWPVKIRHPMIRRHPVQHVHVRHDSREGDMGRRRRHGAMRHVSQSHAYRVATTHRMPYLIDRFPQKSHSL